MPEKTLDRPLDCKKTQPIHPKGNQPWIFIGRTDAEVEAPILWPPDEKNWLLGKHWCWERLKAGWEGDDRGWVGWMASPMQWTWVWASSGGQWRTGQPGELQSMGSQRVGHNRATQQQQQDCSGPCGCQSDEAVLSYWVHPKLCLWDLIRCQGTEAGFGFTSYDQRLKQCREIIVTRRLEACVLSLQDIGPPGVSSVSRRCDSQRQLVNMECDLRLRKIA